MQSTLSKLFAFGIVAAVLHCASLSYAQDHELEGGALFEPNDIRPYDNWTSPDKSEDQDYSKERDRDWPALERLSQSSTASVVMRAAVVSKTSNGETPIYLVVSVTNLGDTAVRSELIVNDYNPLRFMVRSASGEPVRWRKYGRETWGTRTNMPVPLDGTYVHCETVSPGSAIALTTRLDKYIDLSQPGKYTVLAALGVYLDDSDKRSETIVAPPVEFSVSGPKASAANKAH